MAIPMFNFNSNYYIDDQSITFTCPAERPLLVPQDGRRIEAYLDLPHEPIQFDIKYKLLSKTFTTTGVIKIVSNPVFEEKNITREPNEGEIEHVYENIMIKEELSEE